MIQTVTTVAFEVQPASAGLLEQRVSDIRAAQEAPGSTPPYHALRLALPTLHFMSILMVRQAHYDPMLLIEVNFDGQPSDFWAAFAAAMRTELMSLLSLCQPPRDTGPGNRFKTMIATGEPLADVLQDAAIVPTASHLGNRGLPRLRIEQERDLFADVQVALERDPAFQTRPPTETHAALRQQLLTAHPWLAQAAPARISAVEDATDRLRLRAFLAAVAAVLVIPGTVLALKIEWWFIALLGIAAAAVLLPRVNGLMALLRPAPGPKTAAPTRPPAGAGFLLQVLGLTLVILLVAAFALWLLACAALLIEGMHAPSLRVWLLETVKYTAAGLCCVPAVVLAVLYWLRRLEIRDSTHLAPVLDPVLQRRIAEREDHTASVVQNHMGSVVLVKPGGLRTLLLRVGHHALYLILRIQARDGFLSDMRTVHFAHWALLNDGSRLLFMSNFDGTWDSYLDDFIEKADGGTTLAWTNATGSPAARFLMLDGVRKGRQFKAWARHSMSPNLFWFSAYPNLTVNQIERNNDIANGLRLDRLPSGEAEKWISKL